MGKSKLVSAEEAISAIAPGSTIFIGESCGEPQTLVEALVAQKERLKGSRLIDCRRMPGSAYAQLYDNFRIVTLHPTAEYRESIHAGKCDFLPFRLSQAHQLFRDLLPIDVALVQVSAPDSQGGFSLGVSFGITFDAALCAKIIIAEVNKCMPATFGADRIPAGKFSHLVETNRPLLEYKSAGLGESEMAVARNVSHLIDDGSVLSMGIGAIPEALGGLLKGKHKIGIHSGMITDSIIQPVKEGIITNELKNIDKGKLVAGVAMGTSQLFQFINENPRIAMRPFHYTHDIRVIAQLDNFVCINSAVEVDLTGQVNAESLGSTQISTVGGQADFIRGAQLSKGGKSIIALTSTTKDGKTSTIVRRFKEGTIVTTPRYDIEYIVTEYGVAELRGKTLSRRTDALISIAHPKFRDELRRNS